MQDRPAEFLSTLSLRRATPAAAPRAAPQGYFYPRSPCGERHADTINTSFHKLFLSTLSLRRATQHSAPNSGRIRFLSTLSLRRATRLGAVHNTEIDISIHALLAESDGVTVLGIQHRTGISIHALLAESDNGPMQKGQVYYINFYPRSPCGERPALLIQPIRRLDFYPRSPCGERQQLC